MEEAAAAGSNIPAAVALPSRLRFLIFRFSLCVWREYIGPEAKGDGSQDPSTGLQPAPKTLQTILFSKLKTMRKKKSFFLHLFSQKTAPMVIPHGATLSHFVMDMAPEHNAPSPVP